MKRSTGNDVPSSSSTAQTDARVRNDFVPASRRAVFEKIRDLVSPTMPLANLPDSHKARWGDELTAEKMKECIWLRPEAVAQIEFLEWTAGDRLRHAKFAGPRQDKDARSVVKEHDGGDKVRCEINLIPGETIRKGLLIMAVYTPLARTKGEFKDMILDNLFVITRNAAQLFDNAYRENTNALADDLGNSFELLM